ncbi:protein tramtrack, beta isoform-like isoform X4 [Diorhabda carinulata]|uniref:protein tramtrack, beta isoform-like isoform X5 n=1 Tax=Diorhabda sublineata TaxID=1163346 RepID=UPI0024E06770|nr:protein tramtrack, beta isoform-like isoform X5 [Diorhabda sublineata]XP_057667838.1 protein tramtrack, beta isoform-like isoform X4 [Diorhabda carinulata]
MASEQFSLCWDNFHKNMSSGMNSLLENEDLVDVTLAVQGKCLKAHKMVLSVCSPYFKELFKSNPCQHPIVFMKDVSYEALSDLLQFMYQGEVQVSQENLSTFIKTAEALQIKGLTGDGNGSTDNDVTEVPVEKHTPHVEEYKPIPVSRPKKQQLSSAPPTSSPSVKRQRLSSNDAQSIPQTITKVEPVAPSHQSINVSTPEPAAVHFKMEPYDQSQNLLDETGDENFGDDTLDENVGDDTEDYSMMETGTGGPEEEPQAGTSTDGAGEGQDINTKDLLQKIRRKPNMPRYIVDGFVFHVNITKGKPPMIYLRCLEYKRLGCHARAVIPYDGSIHDIKVNRPHNHPPDHDAEEKIVFLRELKEVLLKNPNVPSRTVYATLSEMYPNAAREFNFETIRHKMNRWRKLNE